MSTPKLFNTLQEATFFNVGLSFHWLIDSQAVGCQWTSQLLEPLPTSLVNEDNSLTFWNFSPQERQKRDREQFYAVSSKVSSRNQPQPPDSSERGNSRQRRQQRQERRESSRSKLEQQQQQQQQRRSQHEQELEGSTSEIIENLEPCKLPIWFLLPWAIFILNQPAIVLP